MEQTIRGMVRTYFAGLDICQVVDNEDVYQAVQRDRPETARATIREALQALAAGSARKGRYRSPVVCSVAVRLPELKAAVGRERAYLSIRAIERDKIGEGAGVACREAQKYCTSVLGKDVVDFWLRQAQLQGTALIRNARDQVCDRDGNRCRLCAFIEARGGSAPQQAGSLQVCHLARRSHAWWRIVANVVQETAASDPRSIFTNEGAARIRTRLREDDLHSNPDYMVLLCRYHDAALQRSLYSD